MGGAKEEVPSLLTYSCCRVEALPSLTRTRVSAPYNRDIVPILVRPLQRIRLGEESTAPGRIVHFRQRLRILKMCRYSFSPDIVMQCHVGRKGDARQILARLPVFDAEGTSDDNRVTCELLTPLRLLFFLAGTSLLMLVLSAPLGIADFDLLPDQPLERALNLQES